MRERVLEMAVGVSIVVHVVGGVVLERMDRDEDEQEREPDVVEMEIVEPPPADEPAPPLTVVTLVEVPEMDLDEVVAAEPVPAPGAVADPVPAPVPVPAPTADPLPGAVTDPRPGAVADPGPDWDAPDEEDDEEDDAGTGGLSMRRGTGDGVPSAASAAVAHALAADPTVPPDFDPFNAMPWYRPPEPDSELRPSGGGTHETKESVFTARVDRDGTVEFDDAPNFQIHGMGGSFDLTDWAMRRAGDDPYSSRKLAFLDRTREERAEIALTNRAEDLKDAVGQLSTYLGEIWAYPAWTAAEKRAVLFQLWDECAEKGPADVVEAAERARGTIVSFIRRELPAGSEDAYTTGELRELNRARQSSQMFLPYERR